LISCSNSSNTGALKNSPGLMSSPSHSFLIRLIVTSLRRPSSMLYTVVGVTPDRLANSLGLIFLYKTQRAS